MHMVRTYAHTPLQHQSTTIDLFRHVIYFEHFRKTCEPNMADHVLIYIVWH